MIDFNSNSAFTNVYLGSFQLSRIYVGSNKVWPETTPPIDYSTQYLTFTATESGTFTFGNINGISYSLDNGNTWTSLAGYTKSPTVNAGDKIMWKSTGLTPNSSSGIGNFSSTGSFTVEGNVMSLLYGDSFINQTSLSGKNYAFKQLFSGAKVTSAENLVLPATTLANSCYSQMFGSCTSLTVAPSLPATSLTSDCYNSMFMGCTSLTTAPVLPASTLASSCYSAMFYNCSNLNNVTCLATDVSAFFCTNIWLNNVSATGTFTKAASMTSWTTGDSGIPSGWTVVDAS